MQKEGPMPVSPPDRLNVNGWRNHPGGATVEITGYQQVTGHRTEIDLGRSVSLACML